jgi:hypothetical protein
MMKKILFILMLFISFSFVHSQNAKTIEIKGSTVTKTRGLSILSTAVDDKNAVISPLNSQKVISITVDNSTGYFVQVFIDDVYKGTISAWGKSIITLTKSFKKAYFRTQSETREWSNTGDFNSNTTFKLE